MTNDIMIDDDLTTMDAATTDAAPAPGWYPDRLATIAFRWWDGQKWTEYVRHLEPSEWAITSVRVREIPQP